jgi:hypothetical protein
MLMPALGLGAVLLASAPAMATRPAKPISATSLAADANAHAAVTTGTALAAEHGAAGAAVAAMAAGQWAAAGKGFNAAMQKAAPPAALEKIWQQLVAQYGPYQGHGVASDLPAPVPYRNVVVPVTFGRQVVGMQFSYDAQGAVAGLHLVPPPN